MKIDIDRRSRDPDSGVDGIKRQGQQADEPAHASAAGSAGSTTLFSVAAATQPARAMVAVYNHINGIGPQ